MLSGTCNDDTPPKFTCCISSAPNLNLDPRKNVIYSLQRYSKERKDQSGEVCSRPELAFTLAKDGLCGVTKKFVYVVKGARIAFRSFDLNVKEYLLYAPA